MKIGQGKSKLGIRPNLAVNEQETSKANHPSITSKPVETYNTKANPHHEVKNIQYTNEDLRNDK